MTAGCSIMHFHSYLTADYFRDPNANTGIYHELSHVWDVNPIEKEPCRFESEGRAQFLQFLISQRFDNNCDAISTAVQRYCDAIQKDFRKNTEYQSVALKDYGIADMTQYSYTLGMIIFAMFYELAGEENFNKAIRSYYSACVLRG